MNDSKMLSNGDPTADRACNLECIEAHKVTHEFVGPVKITLVNVPKKVYKRRLCMSGFMALAYLLMGAAISTVLYFTLAFKSTWALDLHIVLCTLGYQLCFPSGIMMISSLNGPSAHMKLCDHKKNHIFIQLLGLACAAAGSTLVIVFGGLKLTPHCIAGLAAGGLSALSFLIGPLAYRQTSMFYKFGKYLHIFCGVPAFVASSVCFILGIFFSKKYEEWVAVKEMKYFPMLFCGLYTLIVVYTPVARMLNCAPGEADSKVSLDMSMVREIDK